MKKTIRYCLIGSYLGGIKTHPQTDVENLGMKVHKYEGVEIADCVMMLVSNLPKELPEYIELSNYKF